MVACFNHHTIILRPLKYIKTTISIGTWAVGSQFSVFGITNASHSRYDCNFYINLLKPTGHVMHQQFNFQQLYALPTLYLRVLYLSENKQRLVPLTAYTDRFL